MILPSSYCLSTMYLHIPILLSTLLGSAFARRNPNQVRRQRVRPTTFQRDTGEVANPPAAVSDVNDNDGNASSNPPFTCYEGNGSNWPGTSQWVSFDSMWSGLLPSFGQGCSGLGPNSDQETQGVRDAIENIAAQSQVDHRFILAIIMNESSGCVRAPTTAGGSGIDNPGLMQDYNGYYTCNCQQLDQYNQQCGLVNPCPQGTISGMVSEGTRGTDAGSGLADLINTVQASGVEGAQVFYKAATFYNRGVGSVSPNEQLPEYAIKVANWVMGWQGGGQVSC